MSLNIAYVPARGGSKSIPRKNLLKLNGSSLICRSARTISASSKIDYAFCSSDDEEILAEGAKFDLLPLCRPSYLSQDDTSIVNVLAYDIPRIEEKLGSKLNTITLVQPTSPFILSRHIDDCVSLLYSHPTYNSIQTLASVKHNSHAVNQRQISDQQVTFAFGDLRLQQYNKQRKSSLYTFGNILAFKVPAFLASLNCFVSPSYPLIIEHKYAFDLDDSSDLELAEALIRSGYYT